MRITRCKTVQPTLCAVCCYMYFIFIVDGDSAHTVTSQFTTTTKDNVSLLSKHYRLAECVHETFKQVTANTVIIKDSQ